MIYWVAKKKWRYALLNFGVIIILSIIFWPLFKTNKKESEFINKGIKILTYNSLNFGATYNKYDLEKRTSILKFIKSVNPDVICLQEFEDNENVRARLSAYQFHHIVTKHTYNEKSTLAIFSKFPFTNMGSLDFSDTSNNTIFVDLAIQNKTLRVYNVHLESLEIRPGSFKREMPRRLLGRLNIKYKKQLEQALLIRKHLENSQNKSIVCGDFNNTRHSGVVGLFDRDMKDSFVEKGNGFGSTYYFKFLPFRIDFIFADESIEIVDHQNFDIKLSDHYPVMATIQLSTD
jgi:endonuclease/exonuclease/phosphatase family metal-dependent hydrolase